MSNLQRLLEAYRDDKRTTNIVDALNKETPARILLKGLLGAQDSFVLSGTYLANPSNYLLICNDKEEAAYLQNNIANILEKKSIHFFPDSFKLPRRFQEINNSNVLLRTETINKVLNSKASGEIIVTYPEALFEKVVAPRVLKKNQINIKKGETLDVNFLMEILIDYGFKRMEFVYEPGQFSIRGGIVDIFSFGNELPYRVELFDEEVESIRTFDPTSQLSTKKIAQVSIVPNINTQFERKDKVSLLQILPASTTVWVKDIQLVQDILQICFEEAEKAMKDLAKREEEEDLSEIFAVWAFIQPGEVMQQLLDFSILELGKKSYLQTEDSIQIDYNTKPQPSFNKNFELLISDLGGLAKEKVETFLFTDSKRQINRFYSIFEDMKAQVVFHPINKAIHQGFIDFDLKVACYTDHQIFERFHRYRIRKGFSKAQALNLRLLRELQAGDFVTHIDHGVGKYSGLEKITVNGRSQESVRLIYNNNDLLYVSINSLHKISKFVGKEGTAPKLNRLGSDAWANLKRKTKKKVKDIAKELIRLYAKRKASKGFAFEPDNYMQYELEASFIYEDTPDQVKATTDVKTDMEKAFPMDRLICGDVGFGKTEIAIRAAFKSVINGKQVAILVPTTILALQHYKTFSERLKEFGVTVDYLNRFRTTKEKKGVMEKMANGQVEIVIGTHALLNKKVKFKDLGLLVIDEEQKFGVAAKEKLRTLKVNVDTLTLTATPIPRTLQFSLMAARDLSVMNTAPPNRQPIHTEIRPFNDKLLKESIEYEVYRGGQVFFVHNRVKTLPDMVALLKRLLPDLDIAMAHGQMEASSLEKTLVDFIDRRYDVLACTNIIETGLDIANANTIIITNAHHFGLSDLHQLRGRVGRSNKKAFCYLFCPPMSTLTSIARKRLRTLEEFSDLGSGLNIAMRDMDIRGAGNLLGGEQSGFIADIGYETYQKILDEAIRELKETEFKELFKEELEKEQHFVKDVQVETDYEMLIPDAYVSSIQERLSLYTELDKITNEEDLETFMKRLSDRFGEIPKATLELFDALRLRWLCRELGFERLILKNNKLRAYFISNAQSRFFDSKVFQNILTYVHKKGDRHLSMKQVRSYLVLIRESCNSLKQAKTILEEMKAGVLGQ